MLSLFLFLIACSSQPATKNTEPNVKVANKAKAADKNKGKTEKKEAANKGYTDYGKPFTLEKSMPASDLLAKPADFVDKKIRVEAKVTDVCQKAGCWLVITDNNKSMRITTKDHKFFVAKDGAGSRCHIEGNVIARAKDPSRTAHFESESSKGAPIPEKEAKGDKIYEIDASSIRFYKKKQP